MKHLFKFIVIIICLYYSLLAVDSCVISCKDSNRDKLEADIRSASQKGDYAKAYKLVNKFDSGYGYRKKELYIYVANQEAIFLMSQGYYDRVKSLYLQTRSAIGESIFNKDLIESFNEIVLGQAISEDRYDFIIEYISIAEIEGENKEKLKEYFIRQSTTEAINFILKDIMNNINEIDKYGKEYHTLPQIGEKNEEYIKSYRKFSAKANMYYLEEISKALSYNNTTLATEILSYFKKDIVIDKNGAVSKILQSNEELEAIQKVQQTLQSNQ